MSLFSWMKWSNESRVQPRDEATPPKTSGVIAGRMLIRELLLHVEEYERLAREREHRLARRSLSLYWFPTYPRLHTIITTAELHQLEFLCAQIPPIHVATVLSRFREVLASNTIRPWDLASLLKQIMRDFLREQEYTEEDNLSLQPSQHQQMEAWTRHYKMKQGFFSPTIPNCGDHVREEIPTISGYVDWAMRHSSSFTGSNRHWDLPYFYPVPLRQIGAYSTTL